MDALLSRPEFLYICSDFSLQIENAIFTPSPPPLLPNSFSILAIGILKKKISELERNKVSIFVEKMYFGIKSVISRKFTQ